jgi:hypothetical protein
MILHEERGVICAATKYMASPFRDSVDVSPVDAVTFSLTGFERVDGAEYVQSWLGRDRPKGHQPWPNRYALPTAAIEAVF